MQLKQQHGFKGLLQTTSQSTISFSCKSLSVFVITQNKQTRTISWRKRQTLGWKSNKGKTVPDISPGAVNWPQISWTGRKNHTGARSYSLMVPERRLPPATLVSNHIFQGTGRGQGRKEERKTDRERRREWDRKREKFQRRRKSSEGGEGGVMRSRDPSQTGSSCLTCQWRYARPRPPPSPPSQSTT